MKHKIITFAIIIAVIPQVAFASWWNPFSWSVFKKKDVETQRIEKRTEPVFSSNSIKKNDTKVESKFASGTKSQVEADKQSVFKMHERGSEREDGDNEDEDDEGEYRVATTTRVETFPTQPSSVFTLAQVAQHGTAQDCYSVVSGVVYNLTSWIASHPGGSSAIISMCGHDATTSFMAQHGGQAKPEQELGLFKIGLIK